MPFLKVSFVKNLIKKHMKQNLKKITLLFITAMLLVSCEKDESNTQKNETNKITRKKISLAELKNHEKIFTKFDEVSKKTKRDINNWLVIDTLFNFLINMQHSIMNRTSSITVLQNLDILTLRSKINEIQEETFELIYKSNRQNNLPIDNNFNGTMKSSSSQFYGMRNFKELSEDNEKIRLVNNLIFYFFRNRINLLNNELSSSENPLKKSTREENFVNLNLNNKYNIYPEKSINTPSHNPKNNLNNVQMPVTFGNSIPRQNENSQFNKDININVNEINNNFDNKTADFNNINNQNKPEINVNITQDSHGEVANKTVSTVRKN